LNSQKNEDLRIFLANEQRHHGKIKDYLGQNATAQDITKEMRAVLVDWLVEVVEEFRLDSETLFLTVHYIDRYLSQHSVTITRGKLQLLGVAALLLASKYEEVSVPPVQDMVYISDNTYTREEIIKMENCLLNVMGFEISVFSLKKFVAFFLESAKELVPVELASTLTNVANYLAELVNAYAIITRPSSIGLAIVCLSLHILRFSWQEMELWKLLPQLTQETFNRTLQEVYDICTQDTPHRAVQNKYAQSKYEEVSKLDILPLNLPCYRR
jgi:cyclin A